MGTETLTAEEIFLKGLGFDSPPKHKVIMHWHDIVVLMEAYAVVATEDMYPKEFVEWVALFPRPIPHLREMKWRIRVKDGSIATLSFDELFNYWGQNIEK